MLYIASLPGFIVALGMQFAVESPRWLCKVGFVSLSFCTLLLVFPPLCLDL